MGLHHLARPGPAQPQDTRTGEGACGSTRCAPRQAPGPKDPSTPLLEYVISNQWKRIKKSGKVDIPEGMVIYSFRHFFASNCLTNGIPITDVAEWMGHKSLDITFKIYRHLMPGSIGRAAKILGLGLTA